MKKSLSVDKRSILIDRHDVTFSPIRLTFRQELDWTVWLLRRARIRCLEFYNCSVVNLVTVGYILVTPCRGGFRGFNGALLLCAPIWQWRLSGSLRCKHSCTYSNDTSNLQKSSLCFKQSRRYTAVFCTSYTWSWTGSSCRIEQSAINYHKRRLLYIYTLSPQTNI